MPYTVTTEDGLSGSPEFMVFTDSATLNPIIFSDPTFSLNQVENNPIDSGSIFIFEKGVKHERAFKLLDFTLIDGSSPKTLEEAYDFLFELRKTMTVGQVSAAVSIPGVATEATLSDLNAKTPALGQALMAASSPVVISPNQTPIPTTVAPVTASGNITTQNLVPNGTATANSSVLLILNGASQLSIQTTGTYTGALSVQVTLDGSRWETVTASLIVNASTGAYSATIASASVGIFTIDVASFVSARVVALAAFTGNVAVTLKANYSPLSSAARSTPAGTNTIGTVTANIGSGSLSAGTNAIGDVGLQVRANSTGAPNTAVINSPATPVGQNVKTSSGRVTMISVSNSNASPRWLKVFNSTSVTMGTTAAAYEVMIPANNVPRDIPIPVSIGHSTGIFLAVTGAQGLTNNTAITAGDVVGFINFA